jgi:hypothetical protein
VEIELSQIDDLEIRHYRRVLRMSFSSGGLWEETSVCGLDGRLVICLDLSQHRRDDAQIIEALQTLRLQP